MDGSYWITTHQKSHGSSPVELSEGTLVIVRDGKVERAR
jgi:hypothetical protein